VIPARRSRAVVRHLCSFCGIARSLALRFACEQPFRSPVAGGLARRAVFISLLLGLKRHMVHVEILAGEAPRELGSSPKESHLKSLLVDPKDERRLSDRQPLYTGEIQGPSKVRRKMR
jgi:hypothetical protein